MHSREWSGTPAQREAVARWAERARALHWDESFTETFDASRPAGRWFSGGRLNVSVNCLDRHLPALADAPAIYWEGEPGDRRMITYGDLHAEVVAFTRALRGLGVDKGDRVALYLSWVPETVVAMLACARLGALYALLPVALPADALADRLTDLEPKLVVTQDGAWRRGVIHPLKSQCDDALQVVASVEHTVVVRRTGIDVVDFEGDRWYHDLVVPYQGSDDGSDLGRAEPVEADHPLSIMYIASRRGRPTGIVHRSAGLLACASTMHRHGFASLPEDVLWCAVEFSWVVGQSHAVYGPLSCGASTVMYEGTLDTPNHGRAWDIIERYQINTLLTTPSIVRNIRGWVDSPPGSRVGSIKRCVTAGERLDPETAEWLRHQVGHDEATIANAWGMTELGGAVRVRPWLDGGLPDPGLDIFDGHGEPVPHGVQGELVLCNPWPALTLGVHVGEGKIEWDPEKGDCLQYRTGDQAHRDPLDIGPEGFPLITIDGRKDPLISVAAQLVSATEVAEVLEDHPFVRRAEVIDRSDRRRGSAIVACVVLQEGVEPNSTIAAELRTHVHDTLGGLSTPRAFAFCDELPSGVERGVLRHALSMLCAKSTAPSFRLSATQIQSTVAAARA
jgi:acetyl-CoA synthetase